MKNTRNENFTQSLNRGSLEDYAYAFISVFYRLKKCIFRSKLEHNVKSRSIIGKFESIIRRFEKNWSIA